MFNYFKVCIQKYATFSGRARRSEYWYFFLANFLIGIILSFVDLGVGTFDEESGRGLLSSIAQIGLLIPSIAVGVRRMHDVGKSGWYLLIPFYNLYLACTDGDKGSNEYGADPKGHGDNIENHLIS